MSVPDVSPGRSEEVPTSHGDPSPVTTGISFGVDLCGCPRSLPTDRRLGQGTQSPLGDSEGLKGSPVW